MKMMILAHVAFTLFLLAASLFDFYRQEIPLYLYLSATFTGLTNLVNMALTDPLPLSPGGLVVAIMPALVLFLLYKASGGIGWGDVLVFMVSFLYLPAYVNMELFVYSVLVSGFIGIGIYLWGKCKGKNVGAITLPFIPCVFVGWMMVIMFRVTGTYM